MMERAEETDRWAAGNIDFLYRYALLRLRNPSLSEDAVQETLLAALKARDGFRGASSERTWLVGILKHKILDQFRKTEREIARFEMLENREDNPDFDLRGRWKEPAAAGGCDPMGALDQKQFWEGLADCLNHLPAKARRVFILREMDGIAIEQICEVLTITAGNCRVLLYRARMQLRRCLEAKGLESR